MRANKEIHVGLLNPTSHQVCGRSRYRWMTSLTMSTEIIDEMFIPTKITAVPFCGPGCILLAQPGESSHFFARAAIFIYQYSAREGARGVILERQSAFSMGETAPGIGCFDTNTLYIGGENGEDTALMLGKIPLAGACRHVGAGIYLGGLKSAKELVMAGGGSPKDFKFFFNHSEWAPGVLEKELEAKSWDVVKASPEDVLLQDSKVAEFWSRARNTLISQRVIEPHFESEKKI